MISIPEDQQALITNDRYHDALNTVGSLYRITTMTRPENILDEEKEDNISSNFGWIERDQIMGIHELHCENNDEKLNFDATEDSSVSTIHVYCKNQNKQRFSWKNSS
jgi:hypothetical protein